MNAVAALRARVPEPAREAGRLAAARRLERRVRARPSSVSRSGFSVERSKLVIWAGAPSAPCDVRRPR